MLTFFPLASVLLYEDGGLKLDFSLLLNFFELLLDVCLALSVPFECRMMYETKDLIGFVACFV